MIFTELLLQKLAGPNLAEWLAPLVIGLFYVTLSSLLMRDLCPGDCRVACYGRTVCVWLVSPNAYCDSVTL